MVPLKWYKKNKLAVLVLNDISIIILQLEKQRFNTP